MNIRGWVLSLSFLIPFLGCGKSGPQYAPVSGVVKLNGVPYKDAVVTFQPIGSPANPNPGRGSSAYTDENGKFTLMTSEGQMGAVVGKHRVQITTKFETVMAGIPEGWDLNTRGTPDGGEFRAPAAFQKTRVDPIPPEWHGETGNKEFEVPAGGTDQANFDIVTKKK
jgi:hypothetical protein